MFKKLTDKILWLDLNLDLTVLRDNILQADVDETIEGRYLLRHQAVLLKICLDDCPCIFLINLLRVWTLLLNFSDQVGLLSLKLSGDRIVAYNVSTHSLL